MSEAVQKRVSLDKIVIDGRYQRPINEKRVEEMARNFDPRLLGSVELVERADGLFAAVDGQNRIAASKLAGRKVISANVHRNLDAKGEADLFVRSNTTRVQLTPLDRFRAQVFAGAPDQVEIQQVVTDCGFKLVAGTVKNTSGAIASIGGLERIYAAGGEKLLRTTLETLRDAWFGESHAASSNMIRGMGIFLGMHSDQFTEEHVERLKRHPSLSIVRRAQEKASSQAGAISLGICVAEELRRITGLKGQRAASKRAMASV